MIQVLVSGCNGKMGRIVTQLLEQNDAFMVLGGYDRNKKEDYPYCTFINPDDITNHPDIIIDFSVPEATITLLNYAVTKKVPMVIATTGFTNEQEQFIQEASLHIPIFKASNMSFDIYLMGELVSQVASILSNTDIEITETHHNRKIDSPSGTALFLADKIKEARPDLVYNFSRMARKKKREPNEIGFSSIRGGNIVGEHTVQFFGPNETLEIKHTSYSREIFAEGALKAAQFLVSQKKPKIYSMSDLAGTFK